MSNRINEFRSARGWSMAKLAMMVGTTAPTIQKLEKGERKLSLDWMVRLADAFGCKPADLIKGSPTRSDPPRPIDKELLEHVMVRAERMLREEQSKLGIKERAQLFAELYEIAQKHYEQGLNNTNPDFMYDFSDALARAIKKR